MSLLTDHVSGHTKPKQCEHMQALCCTISRRERNEKCTRKREERKKSNPPQTAKHQLNNTINKIDKKHKVILIKWSTVTRLWCVFKAKFDSNMKKKTTTTTNKNLLFRFPSASVKHYGSTKSEAVAFAKWINVNVVVSTGWYFLSFIVERLCNCTWYPNRWCLVNGGCHRMINTIIIIVIGKVHKTNHNIGLSIILKCWINES